MRRGNLKFTAKEAADIREAERLSRHIPRAPRRTATVGTLAGQALAPLVVDAGQAVQNALDNFDARLRRAFRRLGIAIAIFMAIGMIIALVSENQGAHPATPPTIPVPYPATQDKRYEVGGSSNYRQAAPPSVKVQLEGYEFGSNYWRGAKVPEPASPPKEEVAEEDSAAGQMKSVPTAAENSFESERNIDEGKEPATTLTQGNSATGQRQIAPADEQSVPSTRTDRPKDTANCQFCFLKKTWWEVALAESELSRNDLEIARRFLRRPRWNELRAEEEILVFHESRFDSAVYGRLQAGKIYFFMDRGYWCNPAAGLTWKAVYIPLPGFAHDYKSVLGFACIR